MSAQPLVILTGAYIAISTVHRWYHTPTFEVIKQTDRPAMFSFFRTTLGLSWCEQFCIYGCLGNLTATAGSATVFQTSDSNFFFSTFGYLIGLTAGSLVWTVMWGVISIKVRDFCFTLPFYPKGFSYAKLNRYLNFVCLMVTLSFSLASFPYYGSDYVIGNMLGFASEDHNLSRARMPQAIFQYQVDWNASVNRKQPFGLAPPVLVPDWQADSKKREQHNW